MDICPRCGTRSKQGNLCNTCRNEETVQRPFHTVPVRVCLQCNSFFHHNTWIPFNDFRQIEKKAMGTKQGEIKPNLTECPKCARRPESNYYEGILQLRNPRQEIVAFIRNFGEQHKERGQFIMKELSVRNGSDFYVANQKLLMRLGKRLQSVFGGIVKTNAKIHTRDTQKSKDIYRMTVLFQAFPFQRHQIVTMDDRIIEITQLGRTCYGVDLDTGKRVLLTADMPLSLLVPVTTSVSKTRPRVEALHPETFESLPLQHAQVKTPEGTSLWVVVHQGKLYHCSGEKNQKKKEQQRRSRRR